MNDCTRLAHWLRTALACGVAGLLAACSSITSDTNSIKNTPDSYQTNHPEGASGIAAKTGSVHRRQAVAAANPWAAQAGATMLRDGGSAIDAAIAAQMVLTLVEPQSSGIGGGAFLLHHDGRRVQAFDGRETAPRAVTPSLFLNEKGQPLPFSQAVVGGRSVGVPGAVRMLAMAHEQHGKLPWRRLFDPAIALAEQGFPVSPRLHTLLSADRALAQDPVARAYFFQPDGQPHPVGHRLRNPELAHVLRLIASQGPRALHEGPVAAAIARTVQQHPSNPGALDEGDLRAYQAKERPPLCFDHDATPQRLRICGFPPPSSGALAIGQILGLLSQSPLPLQSLNGTPTPAWLHTYMEASRLTFADRARYVADPDFVAPPAGRWESLLAPDYLQQRARLMGPTRADSVKAGQPDGQVSAWAPMPDQPEYGTSHLSVVDRYGNSLAMTTTIEAGFGARLMVTTDPARRGGFLLNNQLTDFSFSPADADGQPVANRVEPGKRPRSSMAPTLVLDRTTGQVLMSTGSPGGAMIIHYTAKTLLGTLHGGLSPQAAIDLGNFGTTGGAVMLEAGRFSAGTVDALTKKGHKVQEVPLTSGLQALQRGIVDGQPAWLGGADPRREGVVIGD